MTLQIKICGFFSERACCLTVISHLTRLADSFYYQTLDFLPRISQGGLKSPPDLMFT